MRCTIGSTFLYTEKYLNHRPISFVAFIWALAFIFNHFQWDAIILIRFWAIHFPSWFRMNDTSVRMKWGLFHPKNSPTESITVYSIMDLSISNIISVKCGKLWNECKCERKCHGANPMSEQWARVSRLPDFAANDHWWSASLAIEVCSYWL